MGSALMNVKRNDVFFLSKIFSLDLMEENLLRNVTFWMKGKPLICICVIYSAK